MSVVFVLCRINRWLPFLSYNHFQIHLTWPSGTCWNTFEQSSFGLTKIRLMWRLFFFTSTVDWGLCHAIQTDLKYHGTWYSKTWNIMNTVMGSVSNWNYSHARKKTNLAMSWNNDAKNLSYGITGSTESADFYWETPPMASEYALPAFCVETTSEQYL